MKKTPRFLLGLVAAASFAACDRPAPRAEAEATPGPVTESRTRTLETERISKALADYEASPTAENKADVDKALAALDSEIAELEQRVSTTAGEKREEAAAKLKNLRDFRASQSVRFTALQARSAVTGRPAGAPVDDRSASEKTEDTARRTGDRLENAADRAGNALENAADRAGNAIRDAVK